MGRLAKLASSINAPALPPAPILILPFLLLAGRLLILHGGMGESTSDGKDNTRTRCSRKSNLSNKGKSRHFSPAQGDGFRRIALRNLWEPRIFL
jgi:hypothetical protein